LKTASYKNNNLIKKQPHTKKTPSFIQWNYH